MLKCLMTSFNVYNVYNEPRRCFFHLGREKERKEEKKKQNSPIPFVCSISNNFLMLSSRADNVCFWVSIRSSSS